MKSEYPILLQLKNGTYTEMTQATWSRTVSEAKEMSQERIPERLHVVLVISNDEINPGENVTACILSLQKSLSQNCERICFHCIVVNFEGSFDTEADRKLFEKLQTIREINHIFYIGNYHSDRTAIDKTEKMNYLREICYAVTNTQLSDENSAVPETFEVAKTVDVLGFKKLKIDINKFFYVSLNHFIRQLEEKIPKHRYAMRNKESIQKVINLIQISVNRELPDTIFNLPYFVTEASNLYHYVNLEEAEQHLFGDEMRKLTNMFGELSTKTRDRLKCEIEQIFTQIWIDALISYKVSDRLGEETVTDLLEQETEQITERIRYNSQKIQEEYHSSNFAVEYRIQKKNWFSKSRGSERKFIQDYLMTHIYRPLQENNRLQTILDILEQARPFVQNYEGRYEQLLNEWEILCSDINKQSEAYIAEGTDYMNEQMSQVIDGLVAKCMQGRTYLDKEICIADTDYLFKDMLLKEFEEKIWKRLKYLFETPKRLCQLSELANEESRKRYFNKIQQAEISHIRVPALNIGTSNIKCEDEKYYYLGQQEEGIVTAIIKQCKGIDLRNLL